MFTAIITAMTGLYVFSRSRNGGSVACLLSPDLSDSSDCRRTFCSVSALSSAATVPALRAFPPPRAASMAWSTFSEWLPGLLGFGEVYPGSSVSRIPLRWGRSLSRSSSTSPYGLLVFAAVFDGSGSVCRGEWAEKKFGGKQPDPEGSIIGGSRRLTPVRALALSLAVIGLCAAFAGDPYRGHHATSPPGSGNARRSRRRSD